MLIQKARFHLHDVIIQLVWRKPCNLNDHLQMDDSVSRLPGRNFPSLKVAQPGSKDKGQQKLAEFTLQRESAQTNESM